MLYDLHELTVIQCFSLLGATVPFTLSAATSAVGALILFVRRDAVISPHDTHTWAHVIKNAALLKWMNFAT